GVGTELATSRDDPTLSGVYKLIEYNNIPRIKISEEKITYPGIKQVYRKYDRNGILEEDIIMLSNEPAPANIDPLLHPVMKNGRLIANLPGIDEIQRYYLENIKKLSDEYKKLEKVHPFGIKLSKHLRNLTNQLKSKYH
ncbi:hypothetical protein LCGC14_1882560, partial [marine sediment metagenome]